MHQQNKARKLNMVQQKQHKMSVYISLVYCWYNWFGLINRQVNIMDDWASDNKYRATEFTCFDMSYAGCILLRARHTLPMYLVGTKPVQKLTSARNWKFKVLSHLADLARRYIGRTTVSQRYHYTVHRRAVDPLWCTIGALPTLT